MFAVSATRFECSSALPGTFLIPLARGRNAPESLVKLETRLVTELVSQARNNAVPHSDG